MTVEASYQKRLFTGLPKFLINWTPYSLASDTLAQYSKSITLNDFLIGNAYSLVYATLVLAFFQNLTDHYVRERGLPKGKIKLIKKEYKALIHDAKLSLNPNYDSRSVNEQSYVNFKKSLSESFPEFLLIISEIETEINIKKLKRYLSKKQNELRDYTHPDDLNATLKTLIVESLVRKHKRIPTKSQVKRATRYFLAKSTGNSIQWNILKSIKRSAIKLKGLEKERSYQKKFEKRLYSKWRRPIYLLEFLIRLSTEAGQNTKQRLSKNGRDITDAKHVALIHLHVRSLRIANEILTLVKAGFADGAQARWRSLHELAAVSFFLRKHPSEVSKMYLEHDYIRRYKKAQEYKKYYRRLGYVPLGIRSFRLIGKKRMELLSKYGQDFDYSKGYEWIPKSLLKDRSFKSLEKNVRIDKMRPFYSASSDHIHGGSSGRYTMGLMDRRQSKLLLVGPSDYGLADPIQGTGISLFQVTSCLLTLGSNFEDILQLQVMKSLVDELKLKALDAQKAIEKKPVPYR